MGDLIAPWTAIIMTFSEVFWVADRSHLEHVLSALCTPRSRQRSHNTLRTGMLMRDVTNRALFSLGTCPVLKTWTWKSEEERGMKRAGGEFITPEQRDVIPRVP